MRWAGVIGVDRSEEIPQTVADRVQRGKEREDRLEVPVGFTFTT